MMDLAKPEQFDLDRLAEELGALPDAPLALPVTGGLLSLLRPRFGRMGKAGH